MKHTRDFLLILAAAFFLLVSGAAAIRAEKPEKALTRWFFTDLKLFQAQMMDLQEAVANHLPADSLQQKFKRGRITYKRIELFLEYYFPQFTGALNAPAIRMAEDKSPPQGMQVIEEQIFPGTDPEGFRKLLGDTYKLNSVIQILAGFEPYFEVNQAMPDALMEELYRIITLGITGFDSPVSLHSIPENAEALRAVKECFRMMEEDLAATDRDGYRKSMDLLDKAWRYCMEHPDFDSFDRMHFIREYINPVCDWLGTVKLSKGLYDKTRQALVPLVPGVYKYYNLFDSRLVSAHFFAPDSLPVTPALVELGKRLFSDPILAGNNSRSCASCHNPSLGFTDGRPKSLTLDGGIVHRNAPTLWNAALQRDLFYDHRQKFLENLVEEVLANPEEMNSSAQQVSDKISKDSTYVSMVHKAFGDPGMTPRRVSKALATYVRSLVSLNSRFDLYMRGHSGMMNETEIRGFNIFMGKGKCGTCHFPPLFNGMKPPVYSIIESEVIGVPGNADSLHPVPDTDRGRVIVSGSEVHEKSFKTPTVRNVEITAPYMHNGVYRTLEEVVEFYNKGGGRGLGLKVPNQTLPFDHLNLDAAEKKSLVAFMRSLTDTAYLKNY